MDLARCLWSTLWLITCAPSAVSFCMAEEIDAWLGWGSARVADSNYHGCSTPGTRVAASRTLVYSSVKAWGISVLRVSLQHEGQEFGRQFQLMGFVLKPHASMRTLLPPELNRDQQSCTWDFQRKLLYAANPMPSQRASLTHPRIKRL